MEFEFATSIVLLAGCTTAYLGGCEFDSGPKSRPAPPAPSRIEPMIARVLSSIEADLRLAGLGLVAPLAP
jgi:hypothetical protein